LDEQGIRAEVDERNEKIGYKIRESQLEKVPYMLIIGDREVENKTVAVRKRGEGDQGAIGLPQFIETVREDIVLKRFDNWFEWCYNNQEFNKNIEAEAIRFSPYNADCC